MRDTESGPEASRAPGLGDCELADFTAAAFPAAPR